MADVTITVEVQNQDLLRLLTFLFVDMRLNSNQIDRVLGSAQEVLRLARCGDMPRGEAKGKLDLNGLPILVSTDYRILFVPAADSEPNSSLAVRGQSV